MTCFVILTGYCAWMVPGVWRRIVRRAVLVSFVEGSDCFLFLLLISLPPLPFVDVTTSDEDDVILDYGRNEARDKDCEWVVDRHAMGKLCFPCFASRCCLIAIPPFW